VGGGGHRARVYRIQMRFRVNDKSSSACEARAEAAKVAHERQAGIAHSNELSAAKARHLRQWFVRDPGIFASDLDGLRGVIETSADEAPIQKFLQEHPYLLTSVLNGAHGRWLRPQLRLGDKYVADFFMADADSSGIRWQLVELESPRVKPLTKGGEWRKEARHAQYQIESWRHYLRENIDSARKPRDHEGLGLVDIEAGVPGLILISRRSLVVKDPVWMRRNLRMASGIEMHTYDWLLERVEGAGRSSTGTTRVGSSTEW
jgi:hypothetical protein